MPHSRIQKYKGWDIYYDMRYTGDSTWEGRNHTTHRIASAKTKGALKKLIDRNEKPNPGKIKPKLGKWIPAKKVRFLGRGVVQIMK